MHDPPVLARHAFAHPGARWSVLVASAALFAICSGTSLPDGGSSKPASAFDGNGLMLNEILFVPAEGEPQFVELKNSSSANADPNGLSLANHDGETFALPAGLDPLPPGAVLLVVFDGQNRVEGRTVHADRIGFLAAESGSVDLRDATGASSDSVGWSADHVFAVATSSGGINRPPESGTSIGRFPASVAAFDRFAWTPFEEGQASPGAPNPNPRVAGLLPIEGAVLPPSSFHLAWYPAVGARQYRVQVASEETFAAPLVDRTVDGNTLLSDPLAAGSYFWRIQAIAADGSSAPFSRVSAFRVDTSSLIDAVEDALRNHPKIKSSAGGVPFEAEAKKRLGVPQIYQHKDTKMLLLEDDVEEGQHAWDVDHQEMSWTDPADNMNCALAGIVMVNRFLGGTLSQDRLGFELHKNRRPGPEMDLQWDKPGPRLNELAALASFALGVPVTLHTKLESTEAFWRGVKGEIDAGRPVIVLTGEHTQVVKGYRESDAGRYLIYNDPIGGPDFKTDPFAAERGGGFPWVNYLLIPPLVPPAQKYPAFKDEPEIQQDSDGDGVVDFDETNRFRTNPRNRDTDDDKVPDKDDIRASVFDPVHGYALHPNGTGRDFDGDGVPMELDRDSDDGGCSDGLEDRNFNGKPDAGESWNFDKLDDACFAWKGDVYYEQKENKEGASTTITMQTGVTFASPPGSPDLYTLESGTTFYRFTAEIGACTWNMGPIPIPLAPDDGFLAIDTTRDPQPYWGAGETPVTEGTLTVVCPDHTTSVPALAGGAWFLAPPGLFTVKPDGVTIEDTYTDHNGTWRWRFVRGGAAPTRSSRRQPERSAPARTNPLPVF
jgi:hypothetical protein